MAGEQLRLRFQRGEVVVEFEGDAVSVRAELAGFMTNGFGRLLDCFVGTGISDPTEPPEEETDPTEEEVPFEPLTSPGRTLTFAVDHLDLLSGPVAIDLDGDGSPDNVWGGSWGRSARISLSIPREQSTRPWRPWPRSCCSGSTRRIAT